VASGRACPCDGPAGQSRVSAAARAGRCLGKTSGATGEFWFLRVAERRVSFGFFAFLGLTLNPRFVFKARCRALSTFPVRNSTCSGSSASFDYEFRQLD